MGYDSTCKFIAEHFSADLAAWLLGEEIPLTRLDPSELSLEPIRADTVVFLQSRNKVLHIEFQTDPEAVIPFRMLDYRLRLHRRYPDKEVYQVVVYLRRSDSPLVRQQTFSLSGTEHHYQVIRLWEQPAELFLSALGLLPFAALAQTDDPVRTLRQVAEQIETITEKSIQSNVAASAALLAGLVLEKDLILQVLRQDIMRESVIYQEIQAEARQQGISQGIAIGEDRGQQLKAIAIAKKLLDLGMALEEIAQITELPVAQVRQLQQP